MSRQDATMIVGLVDVGWQDVPLREETIEIWVGELCNPAEIFDFDDALAAVRYMLQVSERRPAYAQIYTETRSQARIRRDRAQTPALGPPQ